MDQKGFSGLEVAKALGLSASRWNDFYGEIKRRKLNHLPGRGRGDKFSFGAALECAFQAQQGSLYGRELASVAFRRFMFLFAGADDGAAFENIPPDWNKLARDRQFLFCVRQAEHDADLVLRTDRPVYAGSAFDMANAVELIVPAGDLFDYATARRMLIAKWGAPSNDLSRKARERTTEVILLIPVSAMIARLQRDLAEVVASRGKDESDATL